MQTKLAQGDKLPDLKLNLTDGSTLALPSAMPARYVALLLFRGAW